ASERRRRIDCARQLSWDNHAQRHLHIWSTLLSDGSLHEQFQATITDSMTEDRQIPVKGYGGMLMNQYRREMLRRYWAPRIRRKVASLARRLRSPFNVRKERDAS